MAKKKPTSDTTDAAGASFEVRTPIRHDGDNYAIGESIELTDDQAKPLLELGAVKAVPVVSKANSQPPSE